jgi:hypothetical protein
MQWHQDRRGVVGVEDRQDEIVTLQLDTRGESIVAFASCVQPQGGGDVQPGWPRVGLRLQGLALYTMIAMQRDFMHAVLACGACVSLA